MWGNDFPHPDGTWSDSREIVSGQLEGLPEEHRHGVLYENAARLYGLPVRTGQRGPRG